jgi:predicted Zn-dependent protease
VLGRAKMELESVNAKLLGVVLNDLRPAAGDLTSTYPYKGYARHAYAEHEETAEPPRIASELDAELAADRAGESNEEQVTRKVDLLLSAGKAESAVETAYEALHEAPQALGIRLALARSYAAAGRTGEAQAELLHVLDLDPRNTAALQRLAEMALDAGLEREALRWTEELLEFDPQNAKVQAQMAELRKRLGEGDQSETT